MQSRIPPICNPLAACDEVPPRADVPSLLPKLNVAGSNPVSRSHANVGNSCGSGESVEGRRRRLRRLG